MSNGFLLSLRAIFRKALQRRFLIVKFRENLIEVRDFENFFDFGRQADYFHLSALFDYGNVNARELADSRAIQILQIGQIQDDVLVTLLQKSGDEIAKRSGFKRGQPARDVHERDNTGLANPD